jgi:hypothetical protein
MEHGCMLCALKQLDYVLEDYMLLRQWIGLVSKDFTRALKHVAGNHVSSGECYWLQYMYTA